MDFWGDQDVALFSFMIMMCIHYEDADGCIFFCLKIHTSNVHSFTPLPPLHQCFYLCSQIVSGIEELIQLKDYRTNTVEGLHRTCLSNVQSQLQFLSCTGMYVLCFGGVFFPTLTEFIDYCHPRVRTSISQWKVSLNLQVCTQVTADFLCRRAAVSTICLKRSLGYTVSLNY